MKEVELLKTIFKDSPDILELLNEIDKEIERLHSIIKEVREYLENTPRIVKSIHYRDKESNYAFIENYVKGELLEILDKALGEKDE